MLSSVVVEGQPVDDLVHGFPASGEFLTKQTPNFQSTPHTLRWRIVAKPKVGPAVAFAAHRSLHRLALERALKLMPTVLAALVGVKDSSRCRLPPKPCHLQCIRRHAALHVAAACSNHDWRLNRSMKAAKYNHQGWLSQSDLV